MSGENKIAKQLVTDAIKAAEEDKTMSGDSMGLAILSQVLRILSETRNRKDLESYIDYDLDNLVESDMVITRQ